MLVYILDVPAVFVFFCAMPYLLREIRNRWWIRFSKLQSMFRTNKGSLFIAYLSNCNTQFFNRSKDYICCNRGSCVSFRDQLSRSYIRRLTIIDLSFFCFFF